MVGALQSTKHAHVKTVAAAVADMAAVVVVVVAAAAEAVAAVATAAVAVAVTEVVAEAAATDRLTVPTECSLKCTGGKPPCTRGFPAYTAVIKRLLWSNHPFRVGHSSFNLTFFKQRGRPRMNPKHFHTPVSTRTRCPVCHQPVYSRGGIHPQCAMRQSEPALHVPEVLPEELIDSGETAVVAVAATVPAIRAPKLRPAAAASMRVKAVN